MNFPGAAVEAAVLENSIAQSIKNTPTLTHTVTPEVYQTRYSPTSAIYHVQLLPRESRRNYSLPNYNLPGMN